jgi:hypothetical protein
LAAAAASEDAGRFFRFALSLLHPSRFAERLPSFWASNAKDVGEFSLTRNEPQLHEMTVRTRGTVPRAYFIYIWGQIQGFSRTIRVKNLTLSLVVCEPRRGVIRATWEE